MAENQPGSPETGKRMTPAQALTHALQSLQAGNLAAAVDICQQVLRAYPTMADGWNILGMAAHRGGSLREAEQAFRKAVELVPGNAVFLSNLGLLLMDLGRHAEAVTALTRVTELAPREAAAHINLGAACIKQDLPEAATASLERALALAPGSAEAALNLGYACARQGKTGEAETAYRKVQSGPRSAAARAKLATLLPIIPQSVEEISRCRDRMQTEVEALARSNLVLDDPARDGSTAFHLAYHGEDDKHLMIALARMYSAMCPSLAFVAPHCRDWKLPRRPLRIGFLSAFMRNHSVGMVTRGLIARLDPDHFRTYALFIPPFIQDEISAFIAQRAGQTLVLPRSLDAARRAIAGLELDVLFFQDIGMEPLSYFLAHARLAPVQCTWFGHPDTSGIPSIDYFVSNDLFEPPDAAGHYSEKLHLLKDVGNIAYYYRPEPSSARRSRSDFGLPEVTRLYLCPQTLYKFHPAFDSILGGILQADPESRIVLMAPQVANWATLLRRRMERSLGPLMERVIELPRQNLADFQSLLGTADVLLDTTHFNGFNTNLMGFAAGTPVVTLPGAFQRGRHTAGMYHRMGMTECTAQSPENYVEIAVRLARDGDFASAVRDKIRERRDVLYEDDNVVREFERFFREAAAAAEV